MIEETIQTFYLPREQDRIARISGFTVRPARLIGADELKLYRGAKILFNNSQQSLASSNERCLSKSR